MNTKHKKELVNTLVAEIKMRNQEQEISSVYFGGGTPSMLSISELEQLFQAIGEAYKISPDAEITFEINPDDVQENYLKEIKKMGVNRLSIGVQSWDDKILKWMNRSHNATDAIQCLEGAQKYFDNFSVDLIYGIPETGERYWGDMLQKTLEFHPKHLSCYALTVEEGTVLYKNIQQGKTKNVDDETALNNFTFLQYFLQENGYDAYEISNASLAGFQAVHNTSYWQREDYIGIGPSAHSLWGSKRRWNISSNMGYIQKMSKGEIFWEEEILTPKNIVNEIVMTGLRTKWGVNLQILNEKTGLLWQQEVENELAQLLSLGKVKLERNHLFLDEKFRFQADGIAAQLFWV